MKLKRLEISGFKSFFEKAVIDFPHGITAVVGPNGCGKSNVIDAIRWAMGEQSVKQLRGKSMEDVIFSGTNGKAPLGMAEVSLTLANDNGGGPAELKDFTEINLTRRLYRSGESAYLLNKQPCRLKDIHNVFLGSGMGSKSYAFIQQGNIGTITEAGPEERRYFIEEAAGVTRYKHHKTEALRKIDTTQQNLLRVADIILEIKRQMDSLKRQARKAELFSKYQRRAKELDVRLAAHQVDGLTLQIEQTERLLEGLRDADIEHTAQIKQLDAAVEEIKLDRWQKNQAISDRKTEKHELQRTVDRMEKDIEHLRGEIERLNREAGELQGSRRGLEEQNSGMLAEIAQGETENQRLRAEIEKARAGLEQERTALEAMNAKLAGMNRELDAARTGLVEATAREVQHRNLYQNAATNRENVARRLKRADEEEAQLHQKIGQAQERESRAQAQLDALKQSIAEANQRILAIREELDARSRALAAQVKLAQSLDLERSTARSKHAALKKMEENFEWYKDGVKAVMKRARQAGPDGRVLAGIVGLVADVIEPEAAAAAAVEAALGESLQYIIVEHQPAGLAAIDYLRQQGAGRSGFIPAAALHDTAAGQSEGPDPGRLLMRHVRVAPGCEAIAQALLGNVVLTETLAEAVELFNRNGRIQTIVTRGGDLISPRGFLIGGSKEAAGGILAKKRELRELEQQAAALERSLEAARLEQRSMEAAVRGLDVELQQLIERKNQQRENEIDAEKELFKASEELKGLRRQLEIVQLEQEQLLGESSDLDDQMSRTERALAAMAAEVEAAQQTVAEHTRHIAATAATVQSAQQQAMNLKLELTSLNAKLENRAHSLRRLREFQADGLRRLEQLAQEIGQKSANAEAARAQVQENEQTLDGIYRTIRQIDAEIERNETDYAAIDARLKESDATIASLRDRREKTLEQMRVLELEQAQRQMKREHACSQIEERYHAAFGELRAQLAPAAEDAPAEPPPDTDAMEAELNRYRTKIARIGDVNLGAIQEYQQLGERYEFLTTQKADLEKAIEDLHKVIRKINLVSQERFMQTFQAVNEKLVEVFPRLFNGGTAELVLTDPDKPLETGVEYMIHPPGKKLTRMSLLSGGEKAMAAIAFIFAIFLIRPAAFCLLDEIDAPLDEANIYRFNDLIQHIGQKSQIVMITHNKRTMEFADTLFGITMEQKGVSKVVSVNLRRPESAAA
ncbi:MAG: chromosome segregation protein SMC [Desulfobacterales bacterium]|jgi:chromosome segregation protein|nr:chromosome segregation protein SMC [Desulfobacterales bacterium]